MEIGFVIIAALIIILIAVEYRIKKPGQIILYESNGLVKYRKSNFYPKHFSLVIPNTTYTLTSSVEPEVKGKIGLIVKFSVSVTPSLKNISKLIRIGGWGKDVLNDAAKELDAILQGFVKEYTEKFDIEEIKSEGIANYLRDKVKETELQLGLEIISLTIQSVEPADKKIAEAIRQKEASRILEETEKNNQKVRIQTAQIKLKADEEILSYEHQLALKKIQLKEIEEDKEASLALKKLNEQVKRDKIKLEIEKEEMSMFKNNPELLLLTPQVARLAEASQNLKNAKTVVSFGDIENGSQLAEMLKNFLSGLLQLSNSKK
ncbi:MAG: SPFH domain-containing protein [Bacteroidota bacterium]